MSPRICGAIEGCDYAARAPALRLISELPVDGYEAALDAAMAHPRLREILDAVARMAFAGWAEYYNSPEWACQTIQREIAIASDLAEETVCLSCGKPIAIDDLWDFRHGGDDRRPEHIDCDEGD